MDWDGEKNSWVCPHCAGAERLKLSRQAVRGVPPDPAAIQRSVLTGKHLSDAYSAQSDAAPEISEEGRVNAKKLLNLCKINSLKFNIPCEMAFRVARTREGFDLISLERMIDSKQPKAFDLGVKVLKAWGSLLKDAGEAAGMTKEQAFGDSVLQCHNKIREQYGKPPLTYDDLLGRQAQEWANRLAEKKQFEHRQGAERNVEGLGIAGENLHQQGSTGGAAVKREDVVRAAVASWAAEVEHYDLARHLGKNADALGHDGRTGHFTQVIWKATTKVGCGVATYQDGPWTRYICVCNYFPVGNVGNMYKTNLQ